MPKKIGKIVTLEHETASAFIERWHYSGVCPTGKNIFLGWYDRDSLYAVADYGIGVNPYQAGFLARKTGYAVTKKNLLELKRLCRIEPANPRMPLTSFLAQCHRILRKDYSFVVSYSDPAYGHSGGIYKAANFQHVGKTNPERHVVDKNGVVRHRRYYYRYAQRNGVSNTQARKELGLSVKKTVPKDRWFIKIA